MASRVGYNGQENEATCRILNQGTTILAAAANFSSNWEKTMEKTS